MRGDESSHSITSLSFVFTIRFLTSAWTSIFSTIFCNRFLASNNSDCTISMEFTLSLMTKNKNKYKKIISQ